MNCKYIVTGNTYLEENDTRIGFGIAAVEMNHGKETVLDSYPDLSPDSAKVEQLVQLCNDLELDREHLRDVVDDFLVMA